MSGSEWIPPELLVPRTVGIDGRRLWAILWRRRGQCVHHEVIRAVLYADRDDLPRYRIVHVYVSALRRALAGTPWRIETVRGIGYCLVGPTSPAALERPAAAPGPPPKILRPTNPYGRLLQILWRHWGQYLSRNALMDALYGDRPDPPFDIMIRILIWRLRRALRGTGYRIESMQGVGYRVVAAE